MPDRDGHDPRYGQSTFDPAGRKNKFQAVVSPQKQNGALWLNQDAYFSLADVDGGNAVEYAVSTRGNGVYFFVIGGEIDIAGEKLNKRDGIGLWEVGKIDIRATAASKILAMEVPM